MRNKIKILILTTVFVFTSIGLALNNISKVEAGDSYYIKSIGSSQNDVGNDIVETSDGGYAMTGYTKSYGGSNNDIILTKVDSSGTEEWSKIINGSTDDVGEAIVQTSDGGYAITGMTTNYGGTDEDIIIVKFNSSGVEQWTKTIGGSNADHGYDIVETSDSSLVVTGSSASYGGSDSDIILIKLSSLGVEQWTKTLLASDPDTAYSVIQTSDGGYALTGYSRSFAGYDEDVIVVKFDSSGDEVWTKIVTTSGDQDYGYEIIQVDDGGYTIISKSKDHGGSNYDLLITKLNSSGVEQWSKTIGGSNIDYGLSIVQANDGSYAVTGSSSSYGGTDADIIVSKLSSLGVEEWTKTIGGSIDDYGHSIIATSDGGYALTGRSWSYGGSGMFNIMVIKLDSAGDCSGCAEITAETVTESDETIAELDQSTSAIGENVTESDETVTEVDTAVDELEFCFYTYQASDTDNAGIGVDVAEVISLNCGSDVDFGTLTPGTDIAASSTCTVTTNSEAGYSLDVRRDDSDSTMDHASDDQINIGDLTEWNGSNAADYTGTDLGFNVYAVNGATRNDIWWGTGTTTCDTSDTNNDFAGFPATYETIMTHSSYLETESTTSICYGVDVSGTQRSGAYDGTITYQVYSNP